MKPVFRLPGIAATVCATVLCAATMAPALAQSSRAVPQSREQVQLSFAPLVKQVAPAVVNIYSRRSVQAQASPLLDDPMFRRFFGDQFGQPAERQQSSLGSGVIVQADGLVVTNHHVVENGSEITVALADRREFPAEVVLADERTDLAILRIKAPGEALPFLELGDSDTLAVGDLVLALGNPFGVGQTVTMGIVSAVARTRVGVSDYQFFIQTDAAINPGNSGGALVTMDGKLVGVNTAIFSRSGGSIGIGFAIPANMVRSVVNAALHGGRIERPWLGASGQDVTAEIAQGLGFDRPGGVLINDVYPDGPADRAGLRKGDVVTAIDGRAVEDPQSLTYFLALKPIGQTAEITVRRQRQPLTLRVGLAIAPEVPPRHVTDLAGNQPLAGARVANLSPALAEELGLDSLAMARGVIIMAVNRLSPAQRLRLRPGDVLVRINNREIRTVADVMPAINAGKEWNIQFRRGDQLLNLAVRG